MIVQYIKATKNNLKLGSILIKCTKKGHVFGPMLICASQHKEIKKNETILCYSFSHKGQCNMKKIKLSELARVIEGGLKRKIKFEEKFKY